MTHSTLITAAKPVKNQPNFTTFSELTLGSNTESGYTSGVPFISSLITPVEEPCPTSSTSHRRTVSQGARRPRRLGLNSVFAVVLLSFSSLFGIFGGNDYASAAELVATSPGIGSTLSAVPAQVIFGFDGPLEKFGTAVYVNGKRYQVGVAERGRDAQEAILSLNGLNLAGTYEIFWEATAADGLISKGKVRFIVKAPSRKVPAAKPTPTTVAPTPTATPAPPIDATSNQAGAQGAVPAGVVNPTSAPTPEITPSADNPVAAVPEETPAPDPVVVGAIQVTVVITIPNNKPTKKPKTTKPPKTTLPAAGTAPTIGESGTNPLPASAVDPTIASGTPSGQRPATATLLPTTILVAPKSSKLSAATAPTLAPTTKLNGAKVGDRNAAVPARAPTTPTLGNSDPAVTQAAATSATSLTAKPQGTPKATAAATGSSEIIFSTPSTEADPKASATETIGKTGKPTKTVKPATTKAAKTTTAPTTAPATAVADPSLAAPDPVEATLAPVAPPTSPAPTTTRPKPTTTTTILLSPDTIPASDIEVSVEGNDGISASGSGDGPIATSPTTTRKKRTSITDALGDGTTTPSDSVVASNGDNNASPSTAVASNSANSGAVNGNGVAGSGNLGTPGNPDPAAGDRTNTAPSSATDPTISPRSGSGSASDSQASASATTRIDRPRTEAEIVSGTDAASPVEGAASVQSDTSATAQPSATPGSQVSPSKGSSLTGGKLRKPLKLAGAGALAALMLGLMGLVATLRAPITAFARQRWLSGFGSGLFVAILAIGALAIARELLSTPKSWPRVGLKALGFSALSVFALIRRRSMKRGLSILSDILPSAKNVRVPTTNDIVAASREIDEQVPKPLRLGSVTGQRAKGRHVPELVRRLRKASLIEAMFGAVALLVAAVLLFV
jgi:methionine-rich copper-binding protein CopC